MQIFLWKRLSFFEEKVVDICMNYAKIYITGITAMSIALVAVLNFYLFHFFDRFFLMSITAPYIIILGVILRVRIQYGKGRLMDGCRSAYVWERVLGMLILASALGYLCGFRYNLVLVLRQHGLLDDTDFFSMPFPLDFLQRFDVHEVANNWITHLEHYVSEDTASLIVALTTGNKKFVHLALQDLVRRNGISHLLALSGFHLSIVIIGLQSAVKCIKKITGYVLHVVIIDVVTLTVVWMYCVWIGFIPSLYRAALMFSISVVMRHVVGKSEFLVTWVGTLLVLMLLYPPIMYEHGFILSMLALLGVVAGAQAGSIPRLYIPSMIMLPLCVGLGATVFTAWYSMLVFGVTYPIGILVSVLLTPIVTVFMVLGMFFLFISYILVGGTFTSILQGCAYLLDLSMYGMRRVLIFFSDTVVLDSWSDIVMFYGTVFGAVLVYALIRVQWRYGNIWRVWHTGDKETA